MRLVKLAANIAIILSLAVMATAANVQTAASGAAGSSQKAHDYSLSRSLDAVLRKQQQGNGAVIVDVRNRADFDRLHITSAVHIPLYALKVKPFLKTDLLVLTNNGFNYGALEKEGGRLREQGFDVAILRGGISAWLEKALPVSGDILAGEDIWQVESADVYQEQPYKSFLAVNVSGRKDQDVFPDAVFLNPADKTAADIIKSYIQAHPADSVLVFNDAGDNYPAIRKTLLSTGASRLFFLKGGLNAYKAYLHNLELSRAPREERVKSYNKCKSCGDR